MTDRPTAPVQDDDAELREANQKLCSLRRLCECSGQPLYVQILDETIPIIARAADRIEALSPTPETGLVEALRDNVIAAYKQGALDVHEAWVEGCGEENAPSRDPDFTEAAHDYADAALSNVLPDEVGPQPLEQPPAER